MERESSKECSAFFLWRKGSFSSRNRPSRNSTLFYSRRSAWSVLKCNQGSEVFAEFWGAFCTLWPRQLVLKRNLCIFKRFIDVLQIFSSALKKNYKMCPDLRWILHQSIPPAPSPPPPFRADPRGISIFFCLGWQIPGGGDSWAGKSPGVGKEKEGKCPVLRQQCNIFYWSHTQ